MSNNGSYTIKTQVKNSIKVPIYDGKEPLIRFLKKLEKFDLTIKQEKYDKILDFINKWLSIYKLSVDSLTDFKNISSKIVLSKEQSNKHLLKKYTQSLTNALNLVDDIDNDTNTDEIAENEIIIFVSKLLKSIDYSLQSKIIDENIYYTIKN